MKKILLILLLSLLLNASSLQKHYLFTQSNITVEMLLEGSHNITTVFSIATNQTHYKISTKKVVALLKEIGVHTPKPKFSYITFDKKSPITTTHLEEDIRDYYKSNLPSLHIDSIEIYPRSYVDVLPKEYQFHIGKKNYRLAQSTFYIEDDRRKKIFFNYIIQGHLSVIKANNQLERSQSLSALNSQQSTIVFSKIRSKPLVHVKHNAYELKHRVKKGDVIFMRDVKAQDIVKKGSQVQLIIQNGSLEVQSSARAITSGALYDMITVEKKDGSRLKVKVIGLNQVEVQ